MDRMKKFWAALVSVALAALAAPTLVLAQSGGGTSGGTRPMAGTGSATGGTASGGGDSRWLWLLLAIAVIGIIWYAMTSRRKMAPPR